MNLEQTYILETSDEINVCKIYNVGDINYNFIAIKLANDSSTGNLNWMSYTFDIIKTDFKEAIKIPIHLTDSKEPLIATLRSLNGKHFTGLSGLINTTVVNKIEELKLSLI